MRAGLADKRAYVVEEALRVISRDKLTTLGEDVGKLQQTLTGQNDSRIRVAISRLR